MTISKVTAIAASFGACAAIAVSACAGSHTAPQPVHHAPVQSPATAAVQKANRAAQAAIQAANSAARQAAKQAPSPAPQPSPQAQTATPASNACTTVPGYFAGGQAGHKNASGFCIPNGASIKGEGTATSNGQAPAKPQGYTVNNCPPANDGYGIVNGQCVKIPVGTGQRSQECINNYGDKYPYLNGTHCTATPSG